MRKGEVMSVELKRKISEGNKGKQAGINHPNFGKHLSEETCRKISIAQLGVPKKENAKGHMLVAREWYEANRQLTLERARKWQLENPVRFYYNKKKHECKKRGLPFDLTMYHIMLKLMTAGIEMSKVGRHNGQYNLARLGDVGGYTKLNCRFIPMEENQAEAVANGHHGCRRKPCLSIN